MGRWPSGSRAALECWEPILGAMEGGGSPSLAFYSGMGSAGVLDGGRPEGRLLAPKERTVSNRTSAVCCQRWRSSYSGSEVARPRWGARWRRTSKAAGDFRWSFAWRCELEDDTTGDAPRRMTTMMRDT
jgi:hypothetical protein